MMRSVDLLPGRYASRRRQRRTIALMTVAGLAMVGLLVGWWFMLGGELDTQRQDLAAAEATNADLQAQINELARFAALETEVLAKRGALQTVMTGDIAWPSILTEIAMVIPGEVWLDSLTASAGTTEGAAPVGTESAAVRISDETPTGRIQFNGQSTSMEGVAKWLIRQGSVDAFSAIWLNSATGTTPGTTAQQLFIIDSTLELGAEALSQRFQGDLP
jgi:Tfp pilus assembly protein PilN